MSLVDGNLYMPVEARRYGFRPGMLDTVDLIDRIK